MNDPQHNDQQPSGRDSASQNDIFSRFVAPMSEVPNVLPADLVPCRHSSPVLDDPSVRWPSLNTIFGRDLELTDAKEGLRSQKVNRNITEIANAILNRHEFMSISGRLAVYQPPCWRIMTRDDARRFVAEATAALFPDDKAYLDGRQYDQIIFHLGHDPGIEQLQTIPPPNFRYLCCRDYMYDWHTGECLPHSSSFQRFSFLNIDAESIGHGNGTYWEMVLKNITGGDDLLRQRILEMIGVILSGYPSKSFFFLVGESGTGKSQIVNALRDILGESACVALNDISQLGQKWTPGTIFGKLLCLCGDVPDTPLDSKTIGTIKQLTGGDLIRGELKYKDAFMFENTAKLVFVSNYPLQIPNQNREHALLDRLVVIPCRNPVAREYQIPNLHERLYEETGYIVDLAMQALVEFDARNGGFTPLPEDFGLEPVQAPDVDSAIMEFVQTRCIIEGNTSCPVKDLFQAFRVYFPEVNIDVTQFSKSLCQLYPQIERNRTSSMRKLCGLRLIEAGSEDPS